MTVDNLINFFIDTFKVVFIPGGTFVIICYFITTFSSCPQPTTATLPEEDVINADDDADDNDDDVESGAISFNNSE